MERSYVQLPFTRAGSDELWYTSNEKQSSKRKASHQRS
jgi:hypothetical protein